MTSSHDLILHEDNNEDGIFIVRIWYEEYEVACVRGDKCNVEHVMNLSEALAINLRTLGADTGDITLFDWLRARDYAGCEYDHNYDDL